MIRHNDPIRLRPANSDPERFDPSVRPDLFEGQCSGHSKRSGKRCKRYAILGGTVCPIHGASARQVKEAAKRRLLAEVMPSIKGLVWARKRGQKNNDLSNVIKASTSILDRSGYPAKSEIALDESTVEAMTAIDRLPLDLRMRLLEEMRKLKADQEEVSE